MSTTKWSLPEFTERYEYVKIDPEVRFTNPAGGLRQELRQGVRFQINDRSGVYDHANAYFNVDFRVVTLAGNNTVEFDNATIQNGSQSFIRRMVVENSNGDTIYECTDVDKSSFVKKLLTQSRDYADTVGEDEFWAIDNSKLAASQGHEERVLKVAFNRVNNVKIPLRNYTFFESLDFNNILLTGMQLTIIIDIAADNDLLHCTPTDGDGDELANTTVPYKVIIDKMELWTPLSVLRPQHQDSYNNSIMAGNKLTWNYLRETVRYNRFTTQSDAWRISGVVNPKKLMYFFVRDEYINNQNKNPQHFESIFGGIGTNNVSLNSFRVEVGSDNTFYPRTDYKSTEPSRIYSDLIKYSHIDGSSKETGLQLSRSLFTSMYSMIYIDLDFKKNALVTDTTDIVAHFSLSDEPGVAIRIYCVVLYENEAEFGQIDGNFMVKSTNTKS